MIASVGQYLLEKPYEIMTYGFLVVMLSAGIFLFVQSRKQQASGSPEVGGSLWYHASRRLLRNRLAVVSYFILLIIVLLSLIVPLLSPWGFNQLDYAAFSKAPDFDAAHYWGTGQRGRDIFVRTLLGAQVSLSIGLSATIVSMVIGVSYGAIAGYLGGKIDMLMMRAVDVLYGVPFLFLLILLIAAFDTSFLLVFIAIGAVSWLDMSRIVRGQAISVKNKEYVEAARAIGVPSRTIIFRHIMPNLLGIVVIYVTLTVPAVIMMELFLGFLGLTIWDPFPSWGVMVAEGAEYMQSGYWWMLVFPAIFVSVTLFCFNFIGDGLRDALDPKDR